MNLRMQSSDNKIRVKAAKTACLVWQGRGTQGKLLIESQEAKKGDAQEDVSMSVCGLGDDVIEYPLLGSLL